MHIQYVRSDSGLLILALLLILFLPTALIAAESAPERPLEKVTIAYSSLSANMAPLWITHERGFFRKYGLDAQLVFIESGSTTVQSLTSKDVVFCRSRRSSASWLCAPDTPRVSENPQPAGRSVA